LSDSDWEDAVIDLVDTAYQTTKLKLSVKQAVSKWDWTPPARAWDSAVISLNRGMPGLEVERTASWDGGKGAARLIQVLVNATDLLRNKQPKALGHLA